jgi:hypothetical protein
MRRVRFGAGSRKGHDVADTARRGTQIPYAGQPMPILVSHGDQPPGFAAREITGFIRDIGAALSPDTPPDPDRMREIYARHASRLLP